LKGWPRAQTLGVPPPPPNTSKLLAATAINGCFHSCTKLTWTRQRIVYICLSMSMSKSSLAQPWYSRDISGRQVSALLCIGHCCRSYLEFKKCFKHKFLENNNRGHQQILRIIFLRPPPLSPRVLSKNYVSSLAPFLQGGGEGRRLSNQVVIPIP
jgi:hypothetical protein